MAIYDGSFGTGDITVKGDIREYKSEEITDYADQKTQLDEWMGVEAGEQTYTESASLDSLLKKQGVLRTANLDTLLQQQGIESVTSFDGLLQNTELLATLLDSILLKSQIEGTNLDSIIKRTGIEASTFIDAILTAAGSVELATSLDLLIKRYDISQVTALDVLITISTLLSANVDVLLQKSGIVVTDFTSLIKAVDVVRQVGLDAVLTAVGANLQITNIDVLIQDTELRTVLLGALLQVEETKVTDIDVMLQVEMLRVTSVDAALQALEVRQTDFTAFLYRTGLTEQTALDAIVTQASTTFTVSTGLFGLLAKTDIELATTVDALLLFNVERQASIDAYISKNFTKIVSFDAVVAQRFAAISLLDAVLEVTSLRSTFIDGLLSKADVFALTDLDAILLESSGIYIEKVLFQLLTRNVEFTSLKVRNVDFNHL